MKQLATALTVMGLALVISAALVPVSIAAATCLVVSAALKKPKAKQKPPR